MGTRKRGASSGPSEATEVRATMGGPTSSRPDRAGGAAPASSCTRMESVAWTVGRAGPPPPSAAATKTTDPAQAPPARGGGESARRGQGPAFAAPEPRQHRLLGVEDGISRLEPRIDVAQRIGGRGDDFLVVHGSPWGGPRMRRCRRLQRACRPRIEWGVAESVPRNRTRGVRMGPAPCGAIKGTRMSPFRWIGPDLELTIHVQPGARRSEVQGLHAGAIKIRISARAVEGA